MLRRHNTTLEYNEDQDTYTLNVDGYTTYLTHDHMVSISGYMMENGTKAAEDIANFLKEKDPGLYETKLTPFAENANAYDIYEVIKSQLEAPVHVRKLSE